MPATKKKKAAAKKESIDSLQRKVRALQKSNRHLRKQVQLLSKEEGDFELNLTPEQEAAMHRIIDEYEQNPRPRRPVKDAMADLFKKLS